MTAATRRSLRVLAVALLASLCRPTSAADAPANTEPIVKFVAFGDAGSGTPAQFAVGRALTEVCAARGCNFAVMLGDNFYPDGVHSADDPQFETKFEQPYGALMIPFFVALGNHDNGRDSAHNRYGDFEVAYSHRADRRSGKWHMPARYYTFSAPLEASPLGASPLVDFFVLDSSPLAPYFGDPDPKWDAKGYGVLQLSWLQAQLKRSAAPWKIAMSHHPYVSDGGHGSAGHYHNRFALSRIADGTLWRDFIERGVCAGGVDLMLQGHDHDLEWLKPVPACGKTQFITSGAGGAELSSFENNSNPIYWQKDGRYGFFWLGFDEARMTVAAYTLNPDLTLPRDHDGKPVPAMERSVARVP